MKPLLALLLLILTFTCNAQGQSNQSKVLGTFVFSNKVSKKSISLNYEFKKNNDSGYSLQLFKTNDDSTQIMVFQNFTLDIFKAVFDEVLQPLLLKYNFPPVDNKTKEDKATEVFFAIKARLDLSDDEPLNSYLILKRDSIFSFLSNNRSNYYQGRLSALFLTHTVKELEVVFEQGTINDVTLRLYPRTANSNRDYLIFKNRYPFTISSKFDADRLSKLRLYCETCGGIDFLTRYIRLGDVVMVDNLLENYKKDYSPTDMRVVVSPQSPIHELRKEKRSKILDVAAYSDLMGVSNENPNGLLQIEIGRKVNLFNRHFRFFGSNKDVSSYFDIGVVQPYAPLVAKLSKKEAIYKISFKDFGAKSASSDKEYTDADHPIPAKQQFERSIENNKNIRKIQSNEPLKEYNLNYTKMITSSDSIGYYIIRDQGFSQNSLNYIGFFEPKLRFSKIEENLRNLPYSSNDIGSDEKVNINGLKLFQYQKVSFGSDLNLFKFNLTPLKLSFLINTGLYWYQTNLIKTDTSDSLVNKINAYLGNLNFTIKFSPENRWGASIGYEIINNGILNRNVTFIKDTDKLGQFKFDGFYNTNDVDKLFFRFMLTRQAKDNDNMFVQLHLGYSMNLFAGKTNN